MMSSLFLPSVFRVRNSPNNTECDYWWKTGSSFIWCCYKCTFITRVKTKRKASCITFVTECKFSAHGRKFDKLPQVSSSMITTCVCVFPIETLDWFEVAYLELVKYLTIIWNVWIWNSSFTVMLLFISKNMDKMPLK